MDNPKPDFAKYSAQQLRQILTRIDKERFPDRVREIHERLARLDAEGGAPQDMKPEPPALAGAWRRIGALVVDASALALIGYGLGVLLAEQFEAMGAWGRLVGFAISLGYFGAMESRLFQGQTLGKLALDIRVMSVSGAPLSVPRALARAAAFHSLYFVNGLDIGDETGFAMLIPFTLSVAIAYLLLFNRRTRQSLHDLLVGAIVVRGAGAPKLAPLWRGHFAALGAIAALLLGGHAHLHSTIDPSDVQSLAAAHGQINRLPGVRSVKLAEGETINSAGERARVMTAQANVDATSGAPRELALRMARIVLGAQPSAGEPDILSVAVVRGYDIGIASRWTMVWFNATPSAWREGKIPGGCQGLGEALSKGAMEDCASPPL